MHRSLRRAGLLAAFVAATSPAFADTPAGQSNLPAIQNPEKAPVIVIKVVVHKRQLVSHRSNSVSDTVVVGAATIAKQNNTSFSKVIEANVAGAAASDSGEFHVRGSHGQYTYYLDGAPLPASVSGSFGDLVDPKNIETLRIYTGGFPAKYGDNLAAVFDVTSKAGKPGPPAGSIEQIVQGYRTYQTTGQVGGGSGNFTYFLSGVKESTDRKLDPVTDTVIHDAGNNSVAFGKFDLGLGKGQILMLDAADVGGFYQIPNTVQQEQDGVDDSQKENGYVANLIYRRDTAKSNTELAYYSHSSQLRYNGSPADLTGASVDNPLAEAFENRTADYYGLRLDQTNSLGARNKLGYGFDASTLVGHEFFLFNSSIGGPIQVAEDDQDISGNDRALYAQDDWTPGRWFIDYGLRWDDHKEVIETNQLSPRFNAEYTVSPRDKFHAYYDRLFQPAAVEDIRRLSGSTALQGAVPTPVQPERDNFYEFGWQHFQGPATYGFAAYYKTEENVIDETVIGTSFLTAPFNVQRGYVRGLELTMDGPVGPDANYYANFARSWAKSDGAISGGLFTVGQPPSYFYDDHDQTNTVSFGVDYDHKGNFADLDGEYGSGFPYGQDAAGNVNYLRVEPHLIFNLDLGTRYKRSEFTFTVINLLNHPYVIKQASPFTDVEWGQQRTYGVKWNYSF